jgi:hypothetical protein
VSASRVGFDGEPPVAGGTLWFILVSLAAAWVVSLAAAGVLFGDWAEGAAAALWATPMILAVAIVPVGIAAIVGHIVSGHTRRAWVRFAIIAVVVTTVTFIGLASFSVGDIVEGMIDPVVLAVPLIAGPALAAGAVAPWFAGFASPSREDAAAVNAHVDTVELGNDPSSVRP